MINLVLIALALIWMVFAIVQDIRKREIADWLNFSLVIFALGFRFFYALFSDGSWQIFYQGLIGFGIFLVLGNMFYYLKMFAGGDAKLFMALGAILPFYESFSENLEVFFLFLSLFLIVGAIYGLVSILYFIFKNFKKFGKDFSKKFKKQKNLFWLSLFLALFFLIFGFSQKTFLYFSIFVFVIPYFYLAAKVVDESFMIKKVPIGKLTEGDWLYKDLKFGKKKIKATWDGLTKEDIIYLKKKKVKFILVRYGVQFSPVFLISFVLLVLFLKFGFKVF